MPWLCLFIGAGLAACGDGGTNADAGGDQDAVAADAARLDAANLDATSPDARPDAGPVDTGPQPDSGPIDGGACGCSYGYHHECGQGQTCQLGFGPPLQHQSLTMCVPTGTISSGLGGACTSTTGHTPGSCNAQCVAEAAGSGCSGETHIEDIVWTIRDWYRAMSRASLIPNTPWGPMDENDVREARLSSLTPECVEYLGWTVLGLLELCRGEGTVNQPAQWEHLEWREFRALEQASCTFGSGGLCVNTLADIVEARSPTSTATLSSFAATCPNGLPFGEPCRGPDALECIKNHIQMIARTLP